tara:strand:+ start:26017 stop:26853 length:837 start_codon:yes stop_codon:yes gene_type:complete
MRRKIKRLMALLTAYGPRYVCSTIASDSLQKIGLLDRLQLTKEKIRTDAQQMFENEIAHGPFRGMKVSSNAWWGRYDLASKLLGQYECHVLAEIVALSRSHDHFVDIGAADGYYVVGCVKSGLYTSATAFEIVERGRDVTRENARLNAVDGRIVVRGEADVAALAEIVEIQGPSVVLCDIEGGEFDLLNDAMLNTLQNSTVIVELHDGFIRVEDDRRDNLFKNAGKYFDIRPIERQGPKVNGFTELADWSDDERMLAFSEGRPVLMEWILLSPKACTV